MRNSENLVLYNSFNTKINEFIKSPTEYSFDLKSRFLRQIYNEKNCFIIWFFISLFINLIFFLIFFKSTNKIDSASLFAIFSLLITVLARNNTVNFILFETIGARGKYYVFHQLSNSIGYLHKIMAVSALVWFTVHLCYALDKVAPEYLSIGINLLILFMIIIGTSLAFFRRKYHNTFENIHRYFGYIAIFLLTIYYLQINFALGNNLSQILYKPQSLLICIIVLLLITPWIGTKKIYPKIVHTAPHVIGIQISGKPSFGTYSKITLANGYYHPFGDSMINFSDLKNRTLYITPAGDRTKKIVKDLNKGQHTLNKCIIKKQRNRGFMYNHSVYDHVLIVVTGGGIAPIIPCMVLNKKTKMDVIWIGRAQDKEFTTELLSKLTQSISNHEIGLHILDTTSNELKNFKTANYINLALKAVKHYKPEVVFIMSNQKFTIDMTYALKKQGVKTYGANFDS
ncbi:ferric reductase-like transmembrane domain-containing protein [Halarcobacter sp.]|uniref:ferric reductase-like transmembrane domain-containing protein n=1 Tax=Halarcobacter sp. TaxID=2321133 RepID=UPI002AA69E85|nr:ferric reductase-like transmembrane domain-containing protein [Halarcobacter sp.]